MADNEPLFDDTAELVELETTTVVVNPPPPNRPRKVSGGMWGPMEIAAVTIAAVMVAAAAAAYFFLVMPSNSELAKNRSEADRLEAEVISARSKYGEITDTETAVAKLVTSVDDFEARFLPVTATGQAALYQRVNALINAYGLTNTTGPDFAPLEAEQNKPGQETEEKRGRAKYRSLYPGVYVTTTLEGSYQNLRRFIREIETGREFIIVSAVELAPSETEKPKDDAKPTTGNVPNESGFDPKMANPNRGFGGVPNAGGTGQTTRPRPQGKVHGETVSLHIELAAYFRRPRSEAPAGQ